MPPQADSSVFSIRTPMQYTVGESQILIPESFVALFLDPGRLRPREPWEYVAQRYEWCEDLAQSMLDTAQGAMHGMGLEADDVVRTCTQGLQHPDCGVSPDEAQWVATRLHELLHTGGR